MEANKIHKTKGPFNVAWKCECNQCGTILYTAGHHPVICKCGTHAGVPYGMIIELLLLGLS